MEDVPPLEVPYDTLIVAAGSKYSYFGHAEWAAFAPEVKSLERALEVRAPHPRGVRGRGARGATREARRSG